MSVYDDVLAAVAALADEVEPFAAVTVGPMPAEGGIAIEWSAGSLNTFMDKRAAATMTAALNAQHEDPHTAADALGRIHTTLNGLRSYPAAGNFQITNIKTTGAPACQERRDNNQWLYSSKLEVKFYL